MPGRRLATLIGIAALALAAAAPPASGADEDPARQSPFGGEVPPPRVEPDSTTEPPPGFALSAVEAIAIAAATETVRDELAESPGAEPVAYVRGERWEVDYVDPVKGEVAQVLIDGDGGEVEEAWRDYQVETELARGYEDAIAQKVNAPYVWIPLCVLFLAPFFDPRRPLRLLHLDLAVLLGLGISLFFFNRAEITASVALIYPVLAYFLLRMIVAGLWPRERRGSVIPWAPARWLAIGVVVLVSARIALNVVDSRVIDIGVAGVVGAERITAGEPLYEGGFNEGLDLRGDVYGPANYLAYVPFELLWPWEGNWDGVPAAHAGAIAFDLLCVIGLVALGRRLRSGEEGRALGWALAFAWVACPFTLYTMNANANDSLVAAAGIGALLALRSAPGRGAMVALGAAAKFGSAALAPLFATGTGERRWPSAIVFSLAFAIVIAAVLVPFLPDGGVREVYDRTLGYQAARSSPFSVWGQAPSLDFAQPLVRAAAVALALGVALWPRLKTPVQIAALAAAVTIAVQLTAAHWFYFYVVWFLPFVLVAVFDGYARVLPARRSGSPAVRAEAS
jgi:hypothetical protein